MSSEREPPGPSAARSTDDLARSEAMHRALLESVLDPTVTIDGHGRIVAASDSVRAFGYQPEDLIDRNIRMLMPEPYRSEHDQYLANYRASGVTHILGRTRQFQVVHKDGAISDVELSVARADVPGLEDALFVGSFRDITQRLNHERTLRAQERRLSVLVDHSFQYIGLLRPDGTILEANQAALDATGITRSQAVGRYFWDTRWWETSEEDRERLRRAIRHAAEGEFVRYETVHRGCGATIIHVDFSLKPVPDGDGRTEYLIAEGRNITDLVRAQRAETSMLRALAEIGESAAMLAHEIKNPITAVNTALRAVATHLGEDQAVVLEDLASRMQRLERIMRRTLSFTRPIEVRRNAFFLRPLVDSVVRWQRVDIVASGAEVDVSGVPEDIELWADRGLVEELVTNLLANALEAIPERPPRAGRPHIQIEARVLPGGTTRLAIEDDGPGIPENVKLTLFKPFATTKTKGSGLGLPFCKKVMEAHEGKIDVETGTLGGARFFLEFPNVPR